MLIFGARCAIVRDTVQVKDKVFILKKTRYGDTDLILNCLSAQGARISLFARSALKSRKRFGGGVLEPTHYIHVLYQSKSGSSSAENPLQTLKEASIINDFPGLRVDYARIEAGLYFVRLINGVVKEGEIDSSDLFNLLGNSLRAAETSEHLDRLLTHFEAKLLANQGMLPVEGPEDEILMRAPIAEHGRLPLGEREWVLARSRAKRILQEYL